MHNDCNLPFYVLRLVGSYYMELLLNFLLVSRAKLCLTIAFLNIVVI